MRLLAAGVLLGAFAAGCSSQPAVPRGSVASCTEFGVTAVREHVTVTSLPPACQGLTRAQFSFSVSSALHSAAIGVHGKVAERERLGAASRYLKFLVASVPAAHSQQLTSVPASPRISETALGIAALCGWLVTIALGLQMMIRWLRRGRRGRPPGGRRRRPPARNLAHLGLAVGSLLIWIAYLGTDVTGLAWTACALLAIETGLGMTLVFVSAASPVGRAGAKAPRPSTAGDPPRSGPGRRRYPAAFTVGTHITFATVTILLAVLAAIGTV